MLMKWNINTMFSETVTLICFSVFFACLAIAFIILILLTIYRKITQTIASTIDLIDSIKKSPLRDMLKRVAIVYEESGALEKEYAIWRTKYEILYEIELQKVMVKLVTRIKKSSSTSPLISNLKAYKEIYETTSDINQRLHTIFMEIKTAFEIETVQRDFVTSQKEIFAKLRDEFTILTLNNFEIDENHLNKTLGMIENLFEEFYVLIQDGIYKESLDTLDKIQQALKFLIELLDAIPYIVSSISDVIPQKLVDLKNKYIIFSSNIKKINTYAQKFGVLESKIESIRFDLKNQIKKLQYKRAGKLLSKAFELIEDFRTEAEHNDTLKNFFEINGESIRANFASIKQSTRAIEIAFEKVNAFSKPSSREWYEFETVRAHAIRTQNRADAIFAELDLASQNNKDINLNEIKDKMIQVMNEGIQDVIALAKSAKAVENQSDNKDTMLNNVVFLQSVLNQCDVKINQYKSISELERFIPPINEMYSQLAKFSKENLAKVESNEQKELISKDLAILGERIWSLVSGLNDAIFLDYISQEIITYMERYVGKVPKIEEVIIRCEKLFEERHLEALLSFALENLTIIKKAR
ncbi:septation ring formation regulator [Spiroplasma chinense]|uniref:Septation ring formation regulator n=1 Tax=Spiroplasma chinense TaxID=216932 RepID=A0A5B9Y538_9MOLU|nr:septation ring formation regulator EzrA [Spiroplasma chinense]QEH62214.1 septation ring formation regulator [Spiroplasma chinense]